MELPKGEGPISYAIRDHDARIQRVESDPGSGVITDKNPRGTTLKVRSQDQPRRSTSSSSVPRWG